MTGTRSIADVRRALAAALADGPPAWLVGGAVREALYGRQSRDLDVAIAGEDAAGPTARTLARALDGHAFALSDAFGAWRVVAREAEAGAPVWQVDLTPLQGPDLPADLARRDLTVNAIAQPVAGGALIDPFGGQEDRAAGRLRMVAPEAFAADPVRVLRLARFTVELEATPEPQTVAAARAAAPRLTAVPGERLLLEVERLLAAPAAATGIAVAEATGAWAALFPAATAADGRLRPPGAAALRRVLAPAPTVPEARAEDRAVLARRAGEPRRRTALGLAALVQGAADPGQALDPLRPSRALRTAVARIAAAPARIAALDRGTVTPRRLFHALTPAGENAPEAVLWARMRGDDPRVPWAALAERAVRWIEDPPRSPVRGDELAAALGIGPGPRIGALLRELAIARDAGEIDSVADAVAWARRSSSGGEAGAMPLGG